MGRYSLELSRVVQSKWVTLNGIISANGGSANQKGDPGEPLWLSVQQAAKLIGISDSRLYDWIAAKKLPEGAVVRLEGFRRVFIRKIPFLNWLNGIQNGKGG